jgi:protein SCO1/2
MTRRSAFIVVFAIALLALGSAWVTIALITNRVPERTSSSSAQIGGPFTLVTADGKDVTDQTYRGKWLLMYFGYTFCPDACPTTLNDMSEAFDKLGSDASKVQPLFITVDPKRDTPQAMADYLKSFDPRIVGLTGSQAQTESVAKAYRVYVAPQKTDGDDYLVDHSSYIYVVNPQGKFVNVIAGNAAGAEMAKKLREMIAHPGT